MRTNFTSKLLAVLLSVSFIATSCKNDGAELAPSIAKPSAASFQEMRAKVLAGLTEKKDFKIADGLTFTSAKGAKVVIYPNCLMDKDGNAATGDATLAFLDIYDRGNMVLANKPVMGVNALGEKEPLVTGGQYNIRVMQGDKELRSGCSFEVTIPASNTGGIDEQMILWNGAIDEDGNLEWNEVPGDGKEAGMTANTDNATYNVWNNEFGWTNVDRFYAYQGEKTKIKVKVPTGYSKDNAAVYLAYEDQPNLLAQLDTWETVDHYFSEHYGFVPVGMKLHVIFVSESNGSFVYNIKPVTIAANATITITDQDLSTGTMAQLKDKINMLN